MLFRSDATQNIEQFMNQANDQIHDIRIGINSIAQSIAGISNNISECSIGVNDIANKTTSVVQNTVESFNRTTSCKESADKLQEITSRFH